MTTIFYRAYSYAASQKAKELGIPYMGASRLNCICCDRVISVRVLDQLKAIREQSDYFRAWVECPFLERKGRGNPMILR